MLWTSLSVFSYNEQPKQGNYNFKWSHIIKRYVKYSKVEASWFKLSRSESSQEMVVIPSLLCIFKLITAANDSWACFVIKSGFFDHLLTDEWIRHLVIHMQLLSRISETVNEGWVIGIWKGRKLILQLPVLMETWSHKIFIILPGNLTLLDILAQYTFNVHNPCKVIKSSNLTTLSHKRRLSYIMNRQ